MPSRLHRQVARRATCFPSLKEVFMSVVFRFGRAWLGLAAVTVAAGLCRGAEPAPSRTYVGELLGGPRSARVALVVKGNDFVAYVCSQDQQFNQDHSRWYEGELKDQRLTITRDGRTLTARVEADQVRGTLVGPDGKELSFTARRTAPNSLVGLYRGEDQFEGDEYVLGWIVDQQHDVVGSCANKKRGRMVVLRPIKRLLPPPVQVETAPEQPPDQLPQDDQQSQAQADQQTQQAQDVLQAKVDPNAQTVVQAQKVITPRVLPSGTKKPLPKNPK
jgi:hypothetical protein